MQCRTHACAVVDKWLLTVSEMADYSENDSESTSSESPPANTTEGAAFYFTSSERDPSGLPLSKVNHSVDNSSSEEDDEGEGDRRTDSSSSSSGESNAEKTAKRKTLVVTFSTSAPSAVDRSVLLGKPLALRTSVRSSSSLGGEEDSSLHESDDTELGTTRAHKRQASDASGSSPPPPKRMSQAGGTDGGTAGTKPGGEYSDFARRMMVSRLVYKCTLYTQCHILGHKLHL